MINSQREAKSGFKGFKSGKILERNIMLWNKLLNIPQSHF